MFRPTRFAATLLLGLGLGLSLLAPLACQVPDDDSTDSPRSADEGELVGVRYEITTADALSKEQVQALASFVEQSGDIVHAKVAVHVDDEGGPGTIMLELWGSELPGGGLVDELEQAFEFLSDAQVAVSELDGEGPMIEGGMPDIDPSDDPETIRQKIIDDLRAKGVEGEITVTVTPTQGGHHEVSVEVEDDKEG